MSAVLDLRTAARAELPRLDCDDATRAVALATWRGRMINEHGSAPVFEALARQCTTAGLEHHAECLLEFAAQERSHGVLCGAVVEALGGEARAEIAAPTAMPTHDDAPAREAFLRNVLSVCCLSETVAVALIGAERLAMPDGELRELLTRILADEVGHARFGWRVLAELAPSIDDATKERLADYLEVAFDHLVEHELAHLPLGSPPSPSAAALGVCDGAAARRLFFDTVASAIVPGLCAHGLAADRAWSRSIARIR
jgi:hypothetical protein